MAKKTGEKYEAIIDAAVKVIAKFGYHQAQVSKIAKEARVADGTIYLYFKSKEDVLISLFSEKMGHFIEAAKEKINQYDHAEDQLKALIQMHFYQFSLNPEYAIVTQLELRQSNSELRREINAILKNYLNLIDQIVQHGIQSGIFKTEIDPILARQMIFGTLDENVTNWVMKDRKYDLNSLTEPIFQLFVHGLRS